MVMFPTGNPRGVPARWRTATRSGASRRWCSRTWTPRGRGRDRHQDRQPQLPRQRHHGVSE